MLILVQPHVVSPGWRFALGVFGRSGFLNFQTGKCFWFCTRSWSLCKSFWLAKGLFAGLPRYMKIASNMSLSFAVVFGIEFR